MRQTKVKRKRKVHCLGQTLRAGRTGRLVLLIQNQCANQLQKQSQEQGQMWWERDILQWVTLATEGVTLRLSRCRLNTVNFKTSH